MRETYGQEGRPSLAGEDASLVGCSTGGVAWVAGRLLARVGSSAAAEAWKRWRSVFCFFSPGIIRDEMDRKKTQVVFVFSEHTHKTTKVAEKKRKSTGRQDRQAATNKNNSNRRSNGASEVMPGGHRWRTCGRTWSNQGGPRPYRIPPTHHPPSPSPVKSSHPGLFLSIFRR